MQKKENWIHPRNREFIGNNKIRIQKIDNQTEEVAYDKAIIATGAETVSLPGISLDSENIMDSKKALELQNIPESLLVIGGGYIGIEQANIYARLGSRVSVVEMTPQLLPGTDEDMVSILAKHLGGCFDKIMLNTKVSRIEQTTEGMKVWFETNEGGSNSQTYSKILVAVGRKPNTKKLGIEHTNVKLDDKGFVIVDDQRKTKDDNIYAIGDVTGLPHFAHKATHEGLTAAEAIAGRKTAFDPNTIPFVEYTELEVAGCGLSEKQAREKGLDFVTVKFPWSASGRALTLGQQQGLTKLILEKSTGRILGAGIVGVSAGRLISECALAIEMGAVAEDLAHTIHPHPTLSETIMEAASLYCGTCINL